jgi:hypothetical protein
LESRLGLLPWHPDSGFGRKAQAGLFQGIGGWFGTKKNTGNLAERIAQLTAMSCGGIINNITQPTAMKGGSMPNNIGQPAALKGGSMINGTMQLTVMKSGSALDGTTQNTAMQYGSMKKAAVIKGGSVITGDAP